MPKTKTTSFKKLFKKQIDGFLKNKKALKIHKAETIHELRVSIKNLRFYLQFLAGFTNTDKDSETILKEIKPLFKSAGKIRTASLNIELVNEKKGPSVYIDHLKKVKKKAGHQLKKSVKSFETKHFRRSCKAAIDRLKTLSSKTVLNEYALFIGKNERGIKNKLKSRTVGTETLHEIRREMKAIKAIQKIGDEINNVKRHQKKLTQLEDAVGKWHDKAILLEDVRAFAKKRGKDAQMNRFIVELHKETTAAQNYSVRSLKKYFA